MTSSIRKRLSTGAGKRLVARPVAVAILSTLLLLLHRALEAQQVSGSIDTGDTAWMLVSSALVLFMTPGLALFYAGMVRSKNVLSTTMHSFSMMAMVGLTWVLWGYSLSFSGHGSLIGDLGWLGLRGVGAAPNPDYAPTIPHTTYMIYQAMFAIITPALISGALAERMKFGAYMAFTFLWSILVYCPVAHWVWGTGGWLRTLGALDFAGGTVVHISSGVAALACALMLGRRQHLGSEELAPHNVTMTVLGAGILWFGWFGFNAGSAIGASALASSAFVATNTAAAAAALSWMAVERLATGKATALGAASGAVAGLVAITPAAGYVGPVSSIIIGLAISPLSYCAIQLKSRLRLDDALDVVGVHFVGGSFGAIATGLFATKAINPGMVRYNGLFFGGGVQLLWRQIVAVAATAVFSFALSIAILSVIKLLSGIRVTREDEAMGLDLTQHGEVGYHLEAV